MRPQLLQGYKPDIYQHPSPLPHLPTVSDLSFHSQTRSGIFYRISFSPRLPMVRSIFTWNSGLAALILLCSLFFTQPFCKAGGSKCFTRDGNPNSDLPCYPTESESFCCASGWACLPNRICALTERSAGDIVVFARGSCTDQLWASTSQCPDFCLASNSLDKGIMVTQCHDPNTYCCGDEPSCNCITGTSTISLSGGLKPFTTLGFTQSATLNASSHSFVTVTTTKSTKKTEKQTWTERVTDTATARPSDTETPSTSFEPSSSNTTSIAGSASNSSIKAASESKEGTKIGVAVGVSLGVLIIASIAMFAFWRERRLKKYMEELKSRWFPAETYQRGVSTAIQPSSMTQNNSNANSALPVVRVPDEWNRR